MFIIFFINSIKFKVISLGKTKTKGIFFSDGVSIKYHLPNHL